MARALLIFDIDGTLFQAQCVTVPAVQRTFSAFGLPPPAVPAITAFFGRPVEEYHAWLTTVCDGVDREALIAATDRLELELIHDEGALYPDAHETLDALRAEGYTLATSSNAPDDYMAAVLDMHGLRSRFDILRNRGSRFPGKEAMVKDIRAPTPDLSAIVIGDRGDDITSAHANGALAIAATYGFGSEAEWRDADARVDALSDVLHVVRRLL